MEVFDNKRVYDDSDEELDLIAPKAKRAQWRHRRVGPAWIKFGRRVKYLGSDLNAYVEDNRVSPGDVA
ncbi:MerR family transcriptional regulator [Phaeobacter sp. HS012]|uniref:MerR family transcriptional regulator n=1 Tax=Aquicoccus porphyridii TaxID=1852029 RepID=A0A5A9ZCB8_9RHOB|nr:MULTISPECIES: MerR family transcriptional regulator [Rhodobacterales]KAA0914867.1 MerR family transcriptional regulator [Aquicoccus porphyridii]MBQ4808545.1 MerR family transcriptional regulator [Phaeobacter sp. HS012]MBQ4883236.1 MerR family transcriptional regulator [Phaeobacter sp. HS011]RAI52587.1 MerR family transcriptional regulator [Rhodobacteraceae bacterium AsT-22]